MRLQRGPVIRFTVMPAHSRSKNGVASLAYVAGIHVFCGWTAGETWMAGTSPAMTVEAFASNSL